MYADIALVLNSMTYTGIQKHDSLSKFFDSVLDGTADLTIVNKEAAQEEFVPDEELLEIERKQEAQRMALAHGGFTNLIDFEEAIKNGAGADFHDKHGFPGMMGGAPPKKAPAGEQDKKEDPIHKILKAQQEAEKKEREKPKMAKTDDGQVAFKAEETSHPKTPVAGEAESASATADGGQASQPSPSSVAEAPVETPEAVPDGKPTGHVTDEL